MQVREQYQAEAAHTEDQAGETVEQLSFQRDNLLFDNEQLKKALLARAEEIEQLKLEAAQKLSSIRAKLAQI